jgi:hypothetical protein
VQIQQDDIGLLLCGESQCRRAVGGFTHDLKI